MPTRRLGLLTSTCLLLATAAQADPAPVAPALFQPIEVRVDAVLLAANLAAIDLAVALGSDQCEDDALDGRPEPAAVSLEPAEAANVASDAEPQPEASIRDGDRDPDTQEEAQPALSKADPAMDTAEATGSAMASAHGVVKVSPADTSEAVAAETVSASPDSGSTAADQQPETAAVLSPEARDATDGTPAIELQHEASAPNTPQAPASALGQTEAAEAITSVSDPAMPSSAVGPDRGPAEVVGSQGERANVTDPLPTPEATGSLSVSDANPAGANGTNQDSDVILP